LKRPTTSNPSNLPTVQNVAIPVKAITVLLFLYRVLGNGLVGGTTGFDGGLALFIPSSDNSTNAVSKDGKG
jgi:hypothetical protein